MIGVALSLTIGVALAVILCGKIIQWVLEGFFAKHFSEREASIASMAAMLGGLPGLLLFDWSDNPFVLAEKLGAAIGLVALWWILFRRSQPVTDRSTAPDDLASREKPRDGS
jgi:hypothetical protein